MLLDEPFAGIDPRTVEDIQNIIAELRSRGLGVLITDHNVRETLEIAARCLYPSGWQDFNGGHGRGANCQ